MKEQQIHKQRQRVTYLVNASALNRTHGGSEGWLVTPSGKFKNGDATNIG